MKLLNILFLLTLVTLVFARCNTLPYEFEVNRIDYKTFQIIDKNGYPIISEGYCIMGHEELGRIEKLNSYTKNSLGFIIKLYTEDKIRRYVVIRPKTIQHYVEIDADYFVYTEEQYKKFKLEDKWHEIE